ncbi:FUSC family protein [Cellulomonas alba]|uniref:FUSC family protein n=1 Tax=Cellulomonas alba TaxID=3053467 RepID=A0ABT7SIW7_9CELL|nr:FUSC family protein [Cellulomonas alba]MDM7855979.1 FUSC family protein [Cellulomonas alba]
MTTTLAPLASAARSAARDVLDPAHLRAALRTQPADSTLAAAVRCAVAVALALAACTLTGHRGVAGFAALAALASLYGRWEPYRRRAGMLAVVAGCLVGAVAVSSLVAAWGAPAVGTVALAAAVAAGTAALCTALRSGPPGATIVVFCVGAGLSGEPTLADIGARVAAAAVGAALAWVVCCAGWLLHPAGPARVAVRRAAGAVDVALATGSAASRRHATALVERARDVLADDATHARGRTATEPLRRHAAVIAARLGPAPAPLPPRRTLTRTLREGLPALDRRPLLRLFVAGLAAGGVAHASGSSHSAWAVMGATATLTVASTGQAVVRGAQRAAGTVAGALVAWPLLEAHLPFAAVAALVVALQLVTEVVVMRHYGLAMLTITPMALLMVSLAGTGDPTALTVDRVLCTLLGAVVALVALVVVPDRQARAAA